MHHSAFRRRLLPLLALCALTVPVLLLTACGDNVPGNAVAKVDDELIETETFNHWMRIAAISAQGPQQGSKAPAVNIPKPPEFTECVAQKRSEERRVGKECRSRW